MTTPIQNTKADAGQNSAKVFPSVGRVPAFNGNVSLWALDMVAAGLSYHIDDNPADVERAAGVRTFTDEEATALRAMVGSLSDVEREEYFTASLATQLTVGSVVSYAKPEEGEEGFRFDLLDDVADVLRHSIVSGAPASVRIRLICSDLIRPVETVSPSDICLA